MKRFRYGLGTKLIGLLLGAMLIIFALLGYLTIRLHRQHLEAAALVSTEGISDVIKRSTTFYMMRNDREALYNAMATMANEPGVVRVRVFDQEGRISYSTDPSETSRVVDKAAEACYGCHSQQQPLAKLNRPDRFRVYRSKGGARVTGDHHPDRKPARVFQRSLPRASREPADSGGAGYSPLAGAHRPATRPGDVADACL